MKTTFSFTLFILLIVAASGCDDEVFEATPRDFPRLLTRAVTEISEKGARFNAEFRYRGESQIISYGFVWNETPFPTLRTPSTGIYAVDENIQAEDFSVFISVGLNPGSTYYVRAFTQTQEYTVYGSNQQFVSKGSENQ